MASPGSSRTVDIRKFIKSLDPIDQGKFEPISGLMVVNLPHDEFMAAFERFGANACTAEDLKLIHTINHETYHAVQAGASGYGFDRQRRLCQLFKKVFKKLGLLMGAVPDLALSMANIKFALEPVRTEAGDDPELKLRYLQLMEVLLWQRLLEMLQAGTLPGDHSLFGALHPDFFLYQAELATREAVRNQYGLSIQALLEGSAVACAHLLMHTGSAEAAMEAELATLPPLYRELYALTMARVGGRAMEVLLPAAALALCYSEPHNAYVEIVSTLATSPAGDALAYGRKLLENLPSLPAAGEILGTSIQLHRGDNPSNIYDNFVRALETRSWGVDAYDVLADPYALNKVGSLPFSIVTADGVQAGSEPITFAELAARMAMMSFVLRVASVRRILLQARNLQSELTEEEHLRLLAHDELEESDMQELSDFEDENATPKN